MDATALAQAYYDALDEREYGRLQDLLAPTFSQQRPEMSLESRDRFVRFMREERPDSETDHTVETVLTTEDGTLAVEGRLLAADGQGITAFVDVFSIDDGRITALRTYTNGALADR
jgi:ketosteroid isomerase-like protein